MDDAFLPLSGTSDRFSINSTGGVENGCSALCDGSPCGGNSQCSVSGEYFSCVPVEGAASGSISVGVIVVIVFFGILIIALTVVFIVCYQLRKRRRSKGDTAKLNGNAHVNKSFGHHEGNNHHDSGFSDQLNDGDYIRSLDQKFSSQRNQKNGRLNAKPDILNSEQAFRQLPLEMDDGTVIIDNGDAINMHPMHDDIPEHYDIDNASSIAPSDIDVVAYYRAHRDGVMYQPHLNNHHNHHHRHHRQGSKESPLTISGQGRNSVPLRESPAMYTNPHMRNSPALLDPNHLHHRNSPTVPGMNNRLSPMNALPPRHSPHVHMSSPMHHSPHYNSSNIPEIHQHSRTDSEPSLASHHTYSSTSSIARNARMSNGIANRPALPHQKPPRVGKILPPQPRNFKGLTKTEVDQLNSRPPQRPSPESLVEALSSSTGHRGLHRGGSGAMDQFGSNQEMLDQLDSSSDGSHNDSFTCSEFENENDKSRTDFDPDALIFSKVPEVDNENDPSILNNNAINNNITKRYDSDGRNSNGDSFGSSEDGPNNGAKPLNGTFNFDYLLNWGPSFEKLVGVFKDIASLPDGEGGESFVEDKINEQEEYV